MTTMTMMGGSLTRSADGRQRKQDRGRGGGDANISIT
jgi:hypothetical protein